MLPYVAVLILGLLIVAVVPDITLVLPRFLGLY
jgi:TRAP-type C4-dicarboxylate transport system permease large subunit